MTAFRQRLLRVAPLLLTVAFTHAAAAEEPRHALRARELFESGRALVARGEHERACPLFEEALLLVSGTGTMFNLADCWERLGRTASAYEMFVATASAAERDRQSARARVARERAEALEANLPRLRLDLGANQPGFRVHCDDREIHGERLRAPMPIDPGRHRIHATAPSSQPWSYEFDVPEGAGLVVVTVPRLDSVEPAASPEALPDRSATKLDLPVKRTAPAVRGKKPTGAAVPIRPHERSGGSNAWAFTIGSVGVAALGATGYFAFRYNDSNEDAVAICPATYGCSGIEIARHAELVSDAKRWRLLTYVGAAVGVASVGTATLLLLSRGGTSIQTSTGVSADGVWLTRVEGSF